MKLCMANNTNVDYSIAIGYTALQQLQSGQHNVGIGFQALVATNGGQFNVALGSEAGKFNITGGGNIFIGYQAGRGLLNNSHEETMLGSDINLYIMSRQEIIMSLSVYHASI